jgi:hypothetical protein
MIIIICLMTFYFFVLLLILWGMYAAIRRQRNDDLRFHLGILLTHIQTELFKQDSRLADRLRALR